MYFGRCSQWKRVRYRSVSFRDADSGRCRFMILVFSDLHSKIHLAFSSADNVLFSRRTLIKILSLFHSCVLLSEWRNKIRQ